jgi:hypothetical protein
MKRLAILAAIVFSFISGQHARAASLYDFTLIGQPGGPFGIQASGIIALDGNGDAIAATGYVGTSIITGVTGVVLFTGDMNQGLFGEFNLTFTTSTGTAAFGHDISDSDLSLSFIPQVTPLPASAPMFGMALLVLAAFGFASKRLKPGLRSPALIVTADESTQC